MESLTHRSTCIILNTFIAVLYCRPANNAATNIVNLRNSLTVDRDAATMLADLDALDAALVGVAGLQIPAANNPYTSE